MIEFSASVRLGSFSLDVDFENDAGITALFGRSGSGKSTVINLVSGLTRPDRGRIVLDGRVLTDTEERVFVPPHRRRIGLVFQDAQLFPHLTVRQNILFGRWFSPRQQRLIPFDAVVETLGIGAIMGRRPPLLSGGEKQRVAFARALLANPRLLLMDEPLAALDMQRKQEILPLIERIRDEVRIPIVYVSHAVEEVGRLATRVVLLDRGRVAAVGLPADVLAGAAAYTPDRFEVASLLEAQVGEFDEQYGLTTLLHPAGALYITGDLPRRGRQVRVVVHATDVALATVLPQHLSLRTVLAGEVESISEADGALAAVTVALRGSGKLVSMATRKAVDSLGLAPGQPIHALVKTVALDERSVGGT